MDYRRASNKQVEYLSALYQQLGEYDDTKVVKYSQTTISKKIDKLKKKLDKRRQDAQQTKMF